MVRPLLTARPSTTLSRDAELTSNAAAARRRRAVRAAKPVIVYALDELPAFDAAFYDTARAGMAKISETIVPPREGCAFDVPAGHFFRIVSIEVQVGDLNLWNAANLAERFFSGKPASRAAARTDGARGRRPAGVRTARPPR